MGTTKARRGLFSLSILLLASFVGVNAAWAQGEVSFIARRDFRVGESPNAVARGDFNGDGRQDLATANSGPSEEFEPTVSILLGRGDGTFQTALDVGVGGIPLSIVVGDFNSDGHQDLATANFANSVSILLGQGDGTFSAAQAFGVGQSPASVTVSDFDSDGRPDLATANAGDFFELGTVSILLNNTAGGVVNALVTFEPIPSTFTFTPDPTGCPAGFVGTFRFEARLTDVSERSLTDLVVAVTTLTNGNLVHNADGGPGSVGARLTVPRQEGFTDGRLTPDEFVDVPFLICSTQQGPFTFEVDVLGKEG